MLSAASTPNAPGPAPASGPSFAAPVSAPPGRRPDPTSHVLYLGSACWCHFFALFFDGSPSQRLRFLISQNEATALISCC